MLQRSQNDQYDCTAAQRSHCATVRVTHHLFTARCSSTSKRSHWMDCCVFRKLTLCLAYWCLESRTCKLRTKWNGRAELTSTVSNWIYEFGIFLDWKRSRSMLTDSSVLLTVNSISVRIFFMVSHNSGDHITEKLLGKRSRGTWERSELWRGLSGGWENSAALVKRYCLLY